MTDPPENRLPPWSDWSGDAIVTALEKAVEELDGVPKWEDYNDHQSGRDDLPSPDTIRRAYGGYRAALTAAGFDYREIFGSMDDAREITKPDGGRLMNETTQHDSETARIEYDHPSDLGVAKDVLDALGVDYDVTVTVAISVNGETVMVEREFDEPDLLGKISGDKPDMGLSAGLFGDDGDAEGESADEDEGDEVNLRYGPTAAAILEHPSEWVTTAQIAEYRGIDQKTPGANASSLHRTGITERKKVTNENGNKVYGYRIKDEYRDMVKEYADG